MAFNFLFMVWINSPLVESWIEWTRYTPLKACILLHFNKRTCSPLYPLIYSIASIATEYYPIPISKEAMDDGKILNWLFLWARKYILPGYIPLHHRGMWWFGFSVKFRSSHSLPCISFRQCSFSSCSLSSSVSHWLVRCLTLYLGINSLVLIHNDPFRILWLKIC